MAMLLKYGSQKSGTGAYHCPLVQARYLVITPTTAASCRHVT